MYSESKYVKAEGVTTGATWDGTPYQEVAEDVDQEVEKGVDQEVDQERHIEEEAVRAAVAEAHFHTARGYVFKTCFKSHHRAHHCVLRPCVLRSHRSNPHSLIYLLGSSYFSLFLLISPYYFSSCLFVSLFGWNIW